MKEKIDKILKELELEQERYKRFLKKGERQIIRERDTFLTKKDRNILIESFVIGGLLENILTRIILRVL